MYASEVGDFIAKFGHLIGWTAMVGIAWKLRGAVEEQIGVWKNIDLQTKRSFDKVVLVDQKVDTMQSNHMKHMQDDLETIAKSNDKAVEVLGKINEGIILLVDRSSGKRDMIVETRIRHEEPSKES